MDTTSGQPVYAHFPVRQADAPARRQGALLAKLGDLFGRLV